MVEIIFNFNQNPVIIQCNENDILKNIIETFSHKAKEKPSKLCFLFSGKNLDINSNQKIGEVFNKEIRNKSNIQILVYNFGTQSTILKNFKISKDIICPNCKQESQIEIKDYKISFYGCKNGHIIKDILIPDYNNKQLIDESKIICEQCYNYNKANVFENQFFVCLFCKKKLCPFCKYNHNNTHPIIDYNQKNYICSIHNEKFSSFCRNCKINLCLECEAIHNDKQNLIYFRDILPNKDKYKTNMKELKKSIDKYKEKINDIKNIFDKIITNLETYYEINNIIFNNYEQKKKNFQLLYNMNELDKFNNIIIYDLNTNINNNKEFNEIINNSMNIMNKMGIKYNGKNIESININNKEKEKDSMKLNLPFEFKEGDKLMSVCFMIEGDEDIHYPVICKDKLKFNDLEIMLYDKYPEYGARENYFICNGNNINRDKTLEENNIKSGSQIIMGSID